MYEDLSDGAPTPFEDGSFVCMEVFLATMMISIEHAFVIVNRLFGTFVWILVIVEFILLIDS